MNVSSEMTGLGGLTCVFGLVLLAAALIVPGPALAAGPAVDEYVLDIPGAGGGKPLQPGGKSDTADPVAPLAPAVAQSLGDSSSDRLLRQLATSERLGTKPKEGQGAKPPPGRALQPSDQSVASIVGSEMDGSLIPLLGVIAVGTAAGLAARRLAR